MIEKRIEFWYDVPDYEGEYLVSDRGSVASIKYGKFRKLFQTKNDGYRLVKLCKNGNEASYRVHRLVWLAIKGEIPEGYHVDHLDFDRGNNCIENLRMLPSKVNTTRWSEDGLKRKSEATVKANKERAKPIDQYTRDGKFVKRWPSASEAARQLGFRSSSKLRECCLDRLKTAYGSIWRYAN